MLPTIATRTNVDTIHTYHPRYGVEAHCRLRLFWRAETAVVVVTELPDNPGMSVTNYAENLATEIALQYGIAPGRLVWIENYPARVPPVYNDPQFDAESFDLATFAWDCQSREYHDPAWLSLGRAAADALAGVTL